MILNLETFKRNWALHYIRPEYLYLPRQEEEKPPEPEGLGLIRFYTFEHNLIYNSTIEHEIEGYLVHSRYKNIYYKIPTTETTYKNGKYYSRIYYKGLYYFIPKQQYVQNNYFPSSTSYYLINVEQLDDTQPMNIMLYEYDTPYFEVEIERRNTPITTYGQMRQTVIARNISEPSPGSFSWWNVKCADLPMVKLQDPVSGQILDFGSAGALSTDVAYNVIDTIPEYYGTKYNNNNYNIYTNWINVGDTITKKTFLYNFEYTVNNPFYYNAIGHSYNDSYQQKGWKPVPAREGGFTQTKETYENSWSFGYLELEFIDVKLPVIGGPAGEYVSSLSFTQIGSKGRYAQYDSVPGSDCYMGDGASVFSYGETEFTFSNSWYANKCASAGMQNPNGTFHLSCNVDGFLPSPYMESAGSGNTFKDCTQECLSASVQGTTPARYHPIAAGPCFYISFPKTLGSFRNFTSLLMPVQSYLGGGTKEPPLGAGRIDNTPARYQQIDNSHYITGFDRTSAPDDVTYPDTTIVIEDEDANYQSLMSLVRNGSRAELNQVIHTN